MIQTETLHYYATRVVSKEITRSAAINEIGNMVSGRHQPDHRLFTMVEDQLNNAINSMYRIKRLSQKGGKHGYHS